MSDEDYPANNALLVAELEAAKLEGKPDDEVYVLVRDLLDLRLDARVAAEARAALTELEAVVDRDDPGGQMLLEYYAGRVLLLEDDAVGAVAAGERAAALAREHEFTEDQAPLLCQLADALDAAGRPDDARKNREEGAMLYEAEGNFAQAGLAVRKLALTARAEDALALHRRAVALIEKSDVPSLMVVVLHSLGAWHAERDEYLPARHALERGLKLAREASDSTGEAYCLEQLAWLEADAFHHQAAIELAGEAHAAAKDDWQRGRALDARGNARHRLHDHLSARADLLEAARAFGAAGEPEWAKDCRRRADGDRLLHYLHYLPSWVFRHKDMSTRESAFKRQFQPFWLWLIGLSATWTAVWTVAAKLEPDKRLRGILVTVAVVPISVMIALSTLLVVLLLVQRFRAKRAE